MDKDELVYELSHAICDYLIKKELCQEGECDSCINKYAKILIEFDEDLQF